MKRALLLPGGGARGVIQLGMIYAYMHQMQWKHPYDALYGTSVGTLNGVLLHQDEFDKAIDLWRTMSNKKIYNWNPLNMFGKGASLMSSAPLAKLVDKYLNVEKLKANPIPFFSTATCVFPLQAETRQLPCSETRDWVLASASAPIAFPTHFVYGKQYTDGGVTRNYNIEKAISDGYDDIVVLCPSALQNRPVKNLIDMLELQMAAQSTIQYSDEVELSKILDRVPHTVTLTIYKPPVVDLGMLDFDGAGKQFDKYFKMGYSLLTKPTLQVRKVIKPV